MGNNNSTATAITSLPDYFNEATLEKLVGGSHQLNRHFYENFKEKSGINIGLISKSIVLEYATVRDIYISFAWGKDHDRRWTQARLSILVKMLRHRGISCHFDDNFEDYKRKHESCMNLIDNSQLFVCCTTSKYMERVNRVNGMKPNKNSFEFNHALHTKGLPRMVFLLLDSSVFNVTAWDGRMAKANQSLNPYHDFSTDTDFDRKISILLANITSLITPLREQTFGVTLPQDETTKSESQLRELMRSKSPMLLPSEWITAQVKLIAQNSLLRDSSSSSPSSSAAAAAAAGKIAHLHSLELLGIGEKGRSLDDNALDRYYERLGEMMTVPETQQDKDSASRFFIYEKQSLYVTKLSRIRKKGPQAGIAGKHNDDDSLHSPYGSPMSVSSPMHQRIRTKSVDTYRRSNKSSNGSIDYQAMVEERERNLASAISEESTTALLSAKIHAHRESRKSEKEQRRLSQLTVGTTRKSSVASLLKTNENEDNQSDSTRRDSILPALPKSKIQRQSSLQQLANRKFSDPAIATSLVHALFGHGPSHAMLGIVLENTPRRGTPHQTPRHGTSTPHMTTPRQTPRQSPHPSPPHHGHGHTPRHFSIHSSNNNMDAMLEPAKTESSSSLLQKENFWDDPPDDGEPPPFVLQFPPAKVSLNPKLEAKWREEKEMMERLAKKGVFVAANTTEPLPSLDLVDVASDARKKLMEKKGYEMSEKTEISMAGTAYTHGTGRHTGALTDGNTTARLSLEDDADALGSLPGGAGKYASDLMKEKIAKTPETERMDEAETQRFLLWQKDQDPRVAPVAWSAAVAKKKNHSKNSSTNKKETGFVSDFDRTALLEAMKTGSKRGSFKMLSTSDKSEKSE